MTREHKLALVVGFSLVLVVGVLISDHFSKARLARLAAADVQEPVTIMPSVYGTVDPRTPPPPAVLSGTPTGVANRPADNGTPTLGPSDSAGPDRPGEETPPTPIIDMGTKPMLASASGAEDDGRLGVRGLSPEPLTRIDPVPVRPEAVEPPLVKPEPVDPSKASPAGPVSKGVLQRHEVVKGDTISRIAHRYYGDRNLWKPLQTYNKNRVSSDGVMRTGVTLLIPPKDVLMGQATLPGDAKIGVSPTAPVAAASKDAEKTAGDRSKSGSIYTVQSGDTLVSIASKQLGNKAKWELIRDLNADTLDDEDTLTVGQKIKLPPRGS